MLFGITNYAAAVLRRSRFASDEFHRNYKLHVQTLGSVYRRVSRARARAEALKDTVGLGRNGRAREQRSAAGEEEKERIQIRVSLRRDRPWDGSTWKIAHQNVCTSTEGGGCEGLVNTCVNTIEGIRERLIFRQ